MRDDNETQSRLTNRMDDAFCNRMCAAIAAGLESAPIGVVTTPGTKTVGDMVPTPRRFPQPWKIEETDDACFPDLRSPSLSLHRTI